MDETIKEIINEIAEELGLPKNKVKAVIRHFFSWQRQQFIELKNACYYWMYFGKFSIIEKRYQRHLEKEKKNKTNIKQNKTKNDYGKDEQTK